MLAGKSTYNYGRDAATREGLDRTFCTPDCTSVVLTSVRAAGTYTLVVSSYQPGHLGSFKLSIRSSMPLNVTSIPAEGAGLFSRKFEGAWTPGQAGGSVRPLENPRVRLRLSRPGQVRYVFLPALSLNRLSDRRRAACMPAVSGCKHRKSLYPSQ